jgi:hypothetical protein
MNITDVTPGQRVLYIPHHAGGKRKHPDCEAGAVSSANNHVIFVRFDAQVQRFGWDGTTSQACDPESLEPLA